MVMEHFIPNLSAIFFTQYFFKLPDNIVCIYHVQHDILKYINIVEWLNLINIYIT